jgi:hypothetical protein
MPHYPLDLINRGLPVLVRPRQEVSVPDIEFVGATEQAGNTTAPVVARSSALSANAGNLVLAQIVIAAGSVIEPYPTGWSFVKSVTFGGGSIWLFKRTHLGSAEPSNWAFLTDNGSIVRYAGIVSEWHNAQVANIDEIGTEDEETSTSVLAPSRCIGNVGVDAAN